MCLSAKAEIKTSNRVDTVINCDSMCSEEAIMQITPNNPELSKLVERDSSSHSKFKAKKIIAAVLAFPVPFGLLGLHRIFLGTKPYIPFVYVGTVGGCFLILPTIDFITILSAEEETFKKFENNPKVFMWSH